MKSSPLSSSPPSSSRSFPAWLVACTVVVLTLGTLISTPGSSDRLCSAILSQIWGGSREPRFDILLDQENAQNVRPSFGYSPVNRDCDIFKGSWVQDSSGPLYTNDSCPILFQPQNCQGNGRPDRDYETYRWKPEACDLPRFDPHAFFQLLSGKTLAFVGDSVARNQMESLMCILWQVYFDIWEVQFESYACMYQSVPIQTGYCILNYPFNKAEVPQNIGSRNVQRWLFASQNVTIVRIWSSWLVHVSLAAFQFAPENLTKLHLEEIDEFFMDQISTFDVLVVSSGHWFVKKAAFISGGEVVGGQLWWDRKQPFRLNNTAAFGIGIKTALKGLVSHPDYKGLTIFRTYSPDHYENGAWNTGGSCTGKTRPFNDSEIIFNGFTELMRSYQLAAFKEAEQNITNNSKLKLMDITPIFAYRADGHPGPYRSLDPNKITKRGPNGRPPPQDCLHWCMPGPIDTWNELLLEILRLELG